MFQVNEAESGNIPSEHSSSAIESATAGNEAELRNAAANVTNSDDNAEESSERKRLKYDGDGNGGGSGAG